MITTETRLYNLGRCIGISPILSNRDILTIRLIDTDNTEYLCDMTFCELFDALVKMRHK